MSPPPAPPDVVIAPSDSVPAPVSMSMVPPLPVVFPVADMSPILELPLTVIVMLPASSMAEPPDVVMSEAVTSRASMTIPPSSD